MAERGADDDGVGVEGDGWGIWDFKFPEGEPSTGGGTGNLKFSEGAPPPSPYIGNLEFCK